VLDVLARGLEVALAAMAAGAPVVDVRAEPVARQSERSASDEASSSSATAVEMLESLYRQTPSRKTISARSTSEKTEPSASARRC
jgi:hypothetical protein